MKPRLSPWLLALLLVVGCALLRLLESLRPDLLPSATPCVALAFIGAMYFPPRWSWLLGVAAIVLSELAFLDWNMKSEGKFFSVMMPVSLGFYALMGVAGLRLSRRAPLPVLFAGPLAGSLLFYFVANTIAWSASAGSLYYQYPQNIAGWIQANTTGTPGYPPSWTFLRNALAADLFFTAFLLAILDPARLALTTRAKKAFASS